jgi:hypothetical protein
VVTWVDKYLTSSELTICDGPTAVTYMIDCRSDRSIDFQNTIVHLRRLLSLIDDHGYVLSGEAGK